MAITKKTASSGLVGQLEKTAASAAVKTDGFEALSATDAKRLFNSITIASNGKATFHFANGKSTEGNLVSFKTPAVAGQSAMLAAGLKLKQLPRQPWDKYDRYVVQAKWR